jgi:hypothetical protein
MKVTFPFTAYVTIDTPFDSDNYHMDELLDWLYEHAMPGVRYSGYSDDSGFVCIPHRPAEFEFDDEGHEFDKNTLEIEGDTPCHDDE